eukprot:Filipodium_phascolosomae@DN1994_c0_g1_i3.p2
MVVGGKTMSPSRNSTARKRKQISPRRSTEQNSRPRRQPGNRRRPILREIQMYQNSTDLLIPKAPFVRVIKDIQDPLTGHQGFRWTPEALMAVQTAAEAYLVGLFADAVLLTYHAKRVTLFVQDLRLARRIRGRFGDF